jgi:hypothetical protein
MALSDYQIALANFNAAMNADPIMRALNEERRAWGDIMLEYDQRTNPSPVRETMDQFSARINVTPSAPPAGEPQTFRSWNAHQPQRQQQRQPQRQQRHQRFDQRPPRNDSNTRAPVPKPQPIPAQKQQKRPRNTFAALSEEDSE